ncbi:MAG: metal-sensing transcriptional repressor [Rhodospirillaceae bacterium]|nr:metal-sensing transcriptional repressor [Rhodospirillaceae bacterium]
MSHTHESHADVVKRLKRAEGHLRAIIAMIEDGRPCPEVAQQMQAVESALHSAKQTFIRDHIDHCLESHLAEGQDPAQTLRAFQAIAKYL